jgi:Rieske Fe-S protein
MKIPEKEKVLARRELIGAGVVGAAYLMLPEGCGGGPSGSSDGGLLDSTAPDAPPDATLVEGGGDCKQDDWTRPISIAKAGIAAKGTAYAFTDSRFVEVAGSGQDRILVIHPLTGDGGYVAMSGICTHMGCCPQYFATCFYNVEEGCSVPESGAADAGDSEGGSHPNSDAGSDGEADAESEGPSDAASDDDAEGGGTTVMTDVLFCPCHGSVFNAKNGHAIAGPALGSGNLQVMNTCVGGGYVFVTIPNNKLGTGIDPECDTP